MHDKESFVLESIVDEFSHFEVFLIQKNIFDG